MVGNIIDKWSPKVKYSIGNVVTFLNRSFILVKLPKDEIPVMPVHLYRIKGFVGTVDTAQVINDLLESYKSTFGIDIVADTDNCWRPL